MRALGRHFLVELFGCDSAALDNKARLENHMQEAARLSNAHVVQSVFHLFNPHGISGVVVIAESHLAIHTWPEHCFASLDFFTCGEEMDPWKAISYLRDILKASRMSICEIPRGELEAQEKAVSPAPPTSGPWEKTLFKTPTKYFLTQGSSEGISPLNAFDGALLSAGIGNTNLIKVSSILPPRCQQVPPLAIPQGALLPVAYASITGNTPGETISAAIAIALPEDESKAGLIMEYASRGSREEAEERVREMALQGMRMRGEEVKEIKSVAAEHEVLSVGAAFAAVTLWD